MENSLSSLKNFKSISSLNFNIKIEGISFKCDCCKEFNTKQNLLNHKICIDLLQNWIPFLNKNKSKSLILKRVSWVNLPTAF